ncbi:hypothetical protein GIV52_10285 [Pseudomonas syringae]|uniref:Uncharacterized protein n=1 Tax=Pseudomonas syringae TaxID=317 RepID=A0A9Q4FGT8_PSESX|nr:hypothetical protein [Pseudomonas syringae]MCF5472300.1 hypothetical protein [Pseudomonas syringae]MCF5481722.1 hypothetical protein [Pseudomonas syringae]MCF5488035.1 hypothetical protein [Pseudomonas syringae]MCF5492046.1 hypothetical protein [Pseudomonas syringae]
MPSSFKWGVPCGFVITDSSATSRSSRSSAGMSFVTLRVTQQFCDVSDVCFRLKAPFRPFSRSHAPRGNAFRDALRHIAATGHRLIRPWIHQCQSLGLFTFDTAQDCRFVTRSVTQCMPTRSIGTIVKTDLRITTIEAYKIFE